MQLYSENCLVYVKASLYKGNELIIWKRSKPTLLNTQRTHLVHELHLQLSDDVQEDERPLAALDDGGDDDSDLLIGKDEDKQSVPSTRSNKRKDSVQKESKISAEEENPAFDNQSDLTDEGRAEADEAMEDDLGSSVLRERQKLMLVLSVRLKTLKSKCL